MKKLLFTLATCACSYVCATETTLLLIRHGETQWNAELRVQGQTNIPLNANGHKQAQDLSEKIVKFHPDIAHIYSSDLDRAYQTAEVTAKQLNLKIEKKTSLREINCGEAEGLTVHERASRFKPSYDEICKQYPDRRERWKYFPAIPEAETWAELLNRVTTELTAIAKAHPGKKIAIFSHGRVIRTLISEVLDTENVPSAENCAIAHFKYSPENPNQPFTFIKLENQ